MGLPVCEMSALREIALAQLSSWNACSTTMQLVLQCLRRWLVFCRRICQLADGKTLGIPASTFTLSIIIFTRNLQCGVSPVRLTIERWAHHQSITVI